MLKVKFINKAIPSVVYPRLMQPQMLQLLIRVLSERLHLWVCIVGQPYYTSTNRRHRGRSTTPRNQQHENFVINDSLSLSGSIPPFSVKGDTNDRISFPTISLSFFLFIFSFLFFVGVYLETICKR